MATWGEFINEIPVVRMGARTIYVTVDDAITLWTERNALRVEVTQLRAALAAEREGCARDVEEFAEACLAESADTEMSAALLQAAAQMIRERDQESDTEPEAENDGVDLPPGEPSDGNGSTS